MLVAAVGGLAACGGGSSPGAQAASRAARARHQHAGVLAQARRFHAFQLFYLGASFDGFPLTRVEEVDATTPDGAVYTFEYGYCAPVDGGGLTGACVYPAAVSETASCTSAGAARRRVRPHATARGVPVAHEARGPGSRVIDQWGVFTRRTRILLAASVSRGPRSVSLSGVLARELSALRSLDGSVGAGHGLPPPTANEVLDPQGCTG
jgi:hypothetical protein